MNKSSSSTKSKENSPVVKGARQTTLFDMKFKSKANEVSTTKPERAVLGESNRPLLNASASEATPEITIDDECENVKPVEAGGKIKKSRTRKQTVEESGVDQIVRDKSKSPKSDSKMQASHKKMLTEDDPVLKKMKIYNFFVRVPQNEVAAAKAKIFSESEIAAKTKKEEEQRRLEEEEATKKLKEEQELLEKKRALEAPYLLGKRVFDSTTEKFIIENHMFGELASMIEFYNTFSSIYDNKSHFKYVAKRDKIEFTKIKFDDMVNMLNANMETPQSRKYFCKLIESLLRILLKYESIYEQYSLLGTDLISSELDENNLQELCRIVATLVFKEHHENEISDKDLLLHDDNEEERHKVLKELRTNQSNDWFINLSLQSRLELLTLFCEQVLYGENFLKQKENLEGKVETMRAGLRDLKAKLKEDYDFALTLKCYTNKGKDLKLPKEILEDEAKKNAVLKIVQKIQDGEAKLKSAEHNLNKFSRIEPLTVDTNGYLYWHFSCIDGIILEKRSASDDGSVEAKSEWYSFTTPDELDNLIGLLNNEPENSKLVSGLKRKYEKLFGQKCRLELAKVKKEAKAKVDIGKMLMGETDAKVKLEGEETKNLNLRSLQFSKDDPENEKQAKYLSVGEIEEELAAEKPPGQFQTPIEKLLERILHNQQKAALNEEEYAAKKQETISSYFEGSSKSFEEKFAFIQKLMIKSFDGFLNDGHLKEAILGEKADLWKKCVEASQSLSNLYYLNFLFTKQINWQIVNQKKKVKTVEMDDEEAELRARRRMARDELAESRPYSLRTLKKVAYDADEQLDKMITEAEQQAEEEEPEQEMEVSPEGSEAVPSEDEAGSDSDYEEEEEEPSKSRPQRRSLRNNKSSSPEESGRRSQRLTKPGKTDEDDTTGRRRSARLIKTE